MQYTIHDKWGNRLGTVTLDEPMSESIPKWNRMQFSLRPLVETPVVTARSRPKPPKAVKADDTA